MADGYVGGTIRDPFRTGIAETVTVNYAILDASTDVSSVVSVDDGPIVGDYVMTIVPLFPGDYQVSWTGDLSGSEFIERYVIVTAAQFDPVAYFSAGVITTVSPVAPNGDVEMIQGDDYASSESRQWAWVTSDAATWPTLTAAAISVIVKNKNGTRRLVKAGTVDVATGDVKRVSVQLTADETARLTPGRYIADVKATLSNGHVVTLVDDLNVVVR